MVAAGSASWGEGMKGSRTDRPLNVLMLELASGDCLAEALQSRGTFDLDALRKVCRQSSDAVAYLHGLRIANRDLKPDVWRQLGFHLPSGMKPAPL